MKSQLSLYFCRRNINVFTALLLTWALVAMPFVPAASAMARGSERASKRSSRQSSSPQATANANAAVPEPAPEPFAASITATKAGAILNDDGDAKADPAVSPNPEKIEYTVTITNNGTTDATNVVFTDTIDAHTTLVNGSVTTQPIAVNDSYSALGNVRIQVPDGASDLLGNDCDPDPLGGPCTNAGLTISVLAGDNTSPFAGTSAQGGQVTSSATDGSFQYNPAPGFEGTDTFTYATVDATGKTDTATVTVTVSGMIWFVNAAAPAGGDGRLLTPFNCLVGTGCFSGTTADDPGDFIFVFSGTYNDNAALVLLNNQKLIGAAATAPLAGPGSITGFTVPTFSDALPGTGLASPIVNSTASGIQLASGNLLRGFTVGNTSNAAGNYDILNTAAATVGTLTVLEVILNGTGGLFRADAGGTLNVSFPTATTTSAGTNGVHVAGATSGSVSLGGGAISGVAGADVLINGGTITFSCASSITHAANSATVDISNHTTGLVTFTATVSASNGTGLQFNNADSTYNFNGVATLGGGDAGIDIIGGSSGTFSFVAGSTITSPTGPAFNVAGSSSPAVTYSGSITQNNAARVVNIDGTSSNTITFQTGTITGGASSTGININAANGNVTFSNGMTLGTNAARMTNQAITINGGTGTYGLGAISVFTNGAQGLASIDANGTLNATGAVNTTNTGAVANLAAVRIDGPAGLTTLGITFSSVNANATAFGIIVQDTDGSFTVAGNASGTDRCGGSVTVNALGTPATFNAVVTGECTGGTLQSITTSGVQATNATNISLSRMNLASANTADGGVAGGTCDLANVSTCNGAIDLTNVTGVTLSRININGAEEQGIVGSNVTGFSLSNSNVQNAGNAAAENGVYFINLFGTVSVSGSRFTGSAFNNFGVLNDGAVAGSALNMTVSGSMFTSNSAIGGDGLVLDTRTNTTSNVSVGTSTFTANRDDHFNFVSQNNAISNVTFNNNTLTGGHASPLGQGIAVRVGGPYSGTFRFDLNTNSVNGAIPTAINTGMGSSTAAAVMHGTIRNNIVGTAGVALSGSAQGSCILVENNGVGQAGHATPAGTYHALVTNNTLKRCFDKGIDVLAVRDGNNTVNVTVSNNNVDELVNASSRWAVRLETGSSLGDETGNVCADIINNTLLAATILDEMSVRARSNATMRFPGYTGGTTNTAQLKAYLEGRNPAGGQAAINPPSGLSTFNNTIPAGSACPQPTLPTLPSAPLISNAAPVLKRIDSVNVAPAAHRATVSQKTQASSTQPSLIARAASAVAQFASDVLSLVEPTAHASEAPSAPASAVASSQSAPVTVRTISLGSNGSDQKVATKVGKNRRMTNSHHAPISRPLTPMVAGETVTINIGTLRPSDSVTITFQVTVNNPPNLTGVPPGPAQVSNQGTVNYNDGATPLSTNTNTVNTPVDLFDTTTTLASDLNPSNFGDLVTFTATVAESPAQATVDPTGTVDFIDTSNGNAVVCDNVALSGGEAECQTSTLTAGTHNIRADYSGDGNFDPSQSNIVAQVVIACATDPIVTSTADNGAGSLREALAQVCTGDTITFDIADAGPHTITLTTGELVVAKNVTVKNASGEKITVSGNNASRVFNINPSKTASIIGLTISGGDSATAGGGILNDGTLTVVNSTLSGNSTDIDGGAISNSGPGILTLINTTISGNNAAGNGGGVVNLGGTVTSVNSTITDNRADSDANSIGTGGGIHHGSGTTTLHNTIVAGNFNEDGVSDAADDISGTVDAASSFNLIGTGGSGGLTNGVNNNQVGVANAGLGPLADNGGLTNTHALLATSSAVEAGSNANLPADTFDLDGDLNTAETLPVDQRGVGFPRTADSQDVDAIQTVDIGAFELHPSIEDITDKSTPEDTLLSFSFNIGDGTGSLIASVTATSGNTTLVPNANINITGSGSTRTIDITPALNANTPSDGTATITVTVTATNGRTATDTFVVTVTEVNDNPVAVDDVLTAIDEDSGTRVIPFADLTGNDSPGPANESGQTLTVTNVSNPVGGTVVINGTNVEFTPTANFFGSASFDYVVTDNGTTNGVLDAKSDTGSASFTINPINDPPSFTIAADPPASNEDDGPQTVLNFATAISAGPNEVGQTLTFNISPVSSTGTLTFSSGPAIDATTGTLTYTATGDTNGTATFSVTLSDNGSNTPPNSNTSAAQQFTITVNAQNDNPVVTTTAGNLNYTENQAATAIDPGLTVTDGDSPNLTGATVAITSGFDSAQDTLGFTNQLGITGNYNSGTGVLTLTGTTTVANYQTALRTVTYQNSSDNPTLSRTVTFTANDGIGTGSATRGIAITAVNDAPVNTVPGAQGTNQNTPLVFSSGSGNQISVADVDAGGADIRVTLTATNGTITLATTAGLNFGAGDGTADATMTFDGTLTEVNTAMNGMTFTPTLGFSGAATLTITTNDLGNSGSGGPLSDTDVVNIQVATNVSIQDAQVAEPSSGSVNMIFTVTLSAPAPAGGAAVDFTTQQEAPALNHATAGSDYTTTSGTVNFAAGEQFKTIQVPVLADNQNSEANETFLVVLSNPVNSTIADGTATGTILIANNAGAILIGELRTSGPAGAGDDFVEIYNNSNSPHVVSATDGSAGYGLFKMGASCSAAPVLIGVIPNGTTIPARGHYLFTGSTYSLGAYGASDQSMSSDIENDRNVGIFSTSLLGHLASTNRFDAVGFGANTGGSCDLLREGTNLTPLVGSVLEYSYFRDECGKKGNPSTFGPCPTGGATKDSNNNEDDFVFVETTGAVTVAGQRLGAPGPQGLGSPRKNDDIFTLLLDATKGANGQPNRERNNSISVPNGATGTLTIRRRFVNTTGGPVTQLRFRIVDISALGTGAIADLRALSSGSVVISGIQDSATCLASTGSAATPCTITVQGTTLEQPPNQPMGGALNSSWNAGSITLGTPLANGASVNIQLVLGVQNSGSFKFFFNIEALP